MWLRRDWRRKRGFHLNLAHDIKHFFGENLQMRIKAQVRPLLFRKYWLLLGFVQYRKSWRKWHFLLVSCINLRKDAGLQFPHHRSDVFILFFFLSVSIARRHIFTNTNFFISYVHVNIFQINKCVWSQIIFSDHERTCTEAKSGSARNICLQCQL